MAKPRERVSTGWRVGVENVLPSVLAAAVGLVGVVVGATLSFSSQRELADSQSTLEQQKVLREQRISSTTEFLASIEERVQPVVLSLCSYGADRCEEPTPDQVEAERYWHERDAEVTRAYVGASIFASDEQLESMQTIMDSWRSGGSYLEERSHLLELLRDEAQFRRPG